MNWSECKNIPLSSVQILLLQDEPCKSQSYQTYLADKGCSVFCCDSLLQIKRIIEQKKSEFTIVLLDEEFVGSCGFEMFAAIKDEFIYTAVLMLCVNNDVDFILESLKSGIDDYMVKPINNELLWYKVCVLAKGMNLQRNVAIKHQTLIEFEKREQYESQLARHLCEAFLATAEQQSSAITSWIKTSTEFSGDCILECEGKDGSRYILFADAIGKGLDAAVSLLPLMQYFSSLAKNALPLANIVSQLNDRMLKVLPDDRFVASAIVRITPLEGRLEIWNGGLPALLLCDKEYNILQEFPSQSMSFGITQDVSFQPHPKNIFLNEGYKLIIYTNGLVNNFDIQGDRLGVTEVVDLVKKEPNGLLAVQEYVEQQLADVKNGISVCVVDSDQLLVDGESFSTNNLVNNGSLQCHYRIYGQAIRTTDMSTQLTELMKSQELPLQFVQRVFTVVTELVLNAIEHGILELDSEIKSEEDGFMLFYAEKERRLQHVDKKSYIDINVDWQADRKQLRLEISDSGRGFSGDVFNVDDKLTFGRGLNVVDKLSSSFEIIPPGNACRAILDGNNLHE
ncbi:SpoIIE family protein phosphatase [Colwelliaceae bacterium 6471]